ncbi:hypothetical protein CHS0354_009841 [Potamilus streckersoni]|uniref:Expansin-like EG45 domain-containing protein n=1 Tax=Potamilus streckersoni TaxID=2493646 RepID=A0AAE0SWC8_9BIVA|nr:hypothetical protein CHS0354_009841 [Potamilus streckersoni]
MFLVTVFAAIIGFTYCAQNADILSLYQHKTAGDGTYYGTGTGGMCQFPPPDLPPVAKTHGMRLVALNAPQMHASLGCGMCFKVHASGKGSGANPIHGDFMVFVKDVCPECHAGSLDFAENGDGRWAIEIQAVQCPVGNTKIEYKFQGSHQYYLKLQTRNSRLPVTEVSVFQPHSQHWERMKRSGDGFWLMGDGTWEKPVQTPMRVRLTAPNGETIEDHIPKIQNDVVIHGNGVQFSLDAHLPH